MKGPHPHLPAFRLSSRLTKTAALVLLLSLSTIASLALAGTPRSESDMEAQTAPAVEAVAEEAVADSSYNPQQTLGVQDQILDPETFPDQFLPEDSYPLDRHSRSWSAFKRDPAGPLAQPDKDMIELAGEMSLKELVGQMTQLQIGMLIGEDGELDRKKVQYWVGEWGVGSFLDTPTNHGGKYISYSAQRFADIVGKKRHGIQKIALDSGRGIPIIYGLDSVHGANYVDGAALFPQQLGVAATFNVSIAYESGRITAKDTRAAGIPWVFGPILDIAVHKLWPRVYETFGEDPHVASQMGSAMIKGLQGNYKEDRTRVAACMKHFIGYSASKNGQDKSSAWIPDNFLLDYFVPSFQAAVDAGVATAMETYIDVNGQPVVGSRFYLTELLRHRLGFKGMLVTDWQELDRLSTEHRSVPSLKQATEQCLDQTTVDMVMVPESESFSRDAAALVQEGSVSKARLVESVAKVLQLKKDLGLFKQPMSDPDLRRTVGSKQDVEAARNAARESITVLKNKDEVLPLSRSGQKIVVTGPAADSIRALSGGWSIKWQGAETDDWYQDRGETILEGLRHEFGKRNVEYRASVDFEGNMAGDENSLWSAAEVADTVILCLGEKPYAEIVGNINEIELPAGQLDLVRKVAERIKGSRTKLVLILVEGRPRGLRDAHEKADAIVMAYLPGPWGGLPLAEILSGRVNPSGRLPLTYPSGAGDMTTSYYRSGVDPYKPLFAFGSGLSYTTVQYRNLKLSSPSLHTTTYGRHFTTTKHSVEYYPEMRLSKDLPDTVSQESFDRNDGEDDDDDDRQAQPEATGVSHRITATIQVENTGDRSVKETVFWYVTQDYRSDIMPEALLLKGFEKIELAPGEKKEVRFVISRRSLVYHGRNLKRKVEKGMFTLSVNAMRPEAQTVKFEVV